MIKLEYPIYQPRIKQQDEKELIFDDIRKAWVILTPEEWVRQNLLQYLTQVKKYPASLIAVERAIKLGELTKRFDIVVYGRNSKPWMIIECKEMNVPLDKAVLEQALRYNITLQVPFLVISNGSYCMAALLQENAMTALDALPDFEQG
jgi:hypothetical protein